VPASSVRVAADVAAPAAALRVNLASRSQISETAPGIREAAEAPDAALAPAGGTSVFAKSEQADPPEPTVATPPEPAVPEPAVAAAQDPVATQATMRRASTLSAAEIAAIVERGRVHFKSGDLPAARLLFRRAANAGDADAAIAMGSTYDPAVLAEYRVRGVSADVDAARAWYERARQMGSPDGPSRIDMLAHR
jgi:TPR repeat protein